MIITKDFTLEVNTCLKSLKSKKLLVTGNITVEVKKSDTLSIELLNICNKVSKNILVIWYKNCIIPIPKKEKLGLSSNYRRLCITCLATKVYNRI